jgi:AraC family transcriptional regulator
LGEEVGILHAWEAVQKTLDIIESRIDEEISIEELAGFAALSPFYYQRLFARLVKKPVRAYIKLRRLAGACEALKNTDKRITDIAFEYGFGSYEVFARGFKEVYGVTPTECRKSDIRLNNFDKPDLMLNYTMVEMGVPLISDGLVLEINRRTLGEPIHFIGIQGHISVDGNMPGGEVTGIDNFGEIWRRFHGLKDKIPGKRAGRDIGVAYRGNAPDGCFTYFVGREARGLTADESFRGWTLPAMEYLVCGFEAENFEELVTVALHKAFKYIGMWQSKNGLKHEGFGAEIYYNGDDVGPGVKYMEIWAPWLEI